MSKQNPIRSGDRVRLNIGDSFYFGYGRRQWVDATIDRVEAHGNHRRYDCTVVVDGSKRFGVHSMDVKKCPQRESERD